MKATLIKDWTVRKGIVIKAGAELELDEIYADQMFKSGVIGDEPNRFQVQQKKKRLDKAEQAAVQAAKDKEEK